MSLQLKSEATYQTITVTPEPSGFGAEIAGLDLARPLPEAVLAEVKAAFARHSVVRFPDQPLSLEQLEAFTLQIGPFGHDPFIKPMAGHPNVLEVRREPDETARNFGAGWHSDWSFQPRPPAPMVRRACSRRRPRSAPCRSSPARRPTRPTYIRWSAPIR